MILGPYLAYVELEDFDWDKAQVIYQIETVLAPVDHHAGTPLDAEVREWGVRHTILGSLPDANLRLLCDEHEQDLEILLQTGWRIGQTVYVEYSYQIEYTPATIYNAAEYNAYLWWEEAWREGAGWGDGLMYHVINCLSMRVSDAVAYWTNYIFGGKR